MINVLEQKYLFKDDKNFLCHGGKRLKNNKISEPLFSIITVVLNNEKYIEETINSVLNQSFKNFEYIIIDGGSKDNTLEIIKKYDDRVDYWVSSKDEGIYDAFNKGMSLSYGKFIGIINSDDIYTQDALKTIDGYIENNPAVDFFFGSVKKHWGVLSGYYPKKIKYSWGFYSSHSTGFFLKRSAAEKNGLYNLKYKYHSDYDYFYRLIVKNKLIGMATKKSEITGIFRRGGFSSTISFRKLFKEELQIRIDNNQNKLLILLIFMYKFLVHFKKIIKG